jgi:hypothetical protein
MNHYDDRLDLRTNLVEAHKTDGLRGQASSDIFYLEVRYV